MPGNKRSTQKYLSSYYSVSYRGIFTKSNLMQAINPINTHTKFGKDRINTFPSNEWKPSVRTPDSGKSKNNMSTPQWGGHN